MSVNFEWDSSYSVGNDDIDTQHQRLFALANSLNDDLGEHDVKSVLMELYKYTRKHFEAEENLMASIDYPKLTAHKLLHDDLLDRLIEISRQNFKEEEAIMDLKVFVFNWLVDHIMNEDMRFAALIKQSPQP